MSPAPEPSRARAAGIASSGSAWSPLRHPVFRWLWIAALVSQTGSFMTDIAQGWLMTTLSASPLKVALLVTVESLPIFLLSLPAGALADVIDRRKLLIAAQSAIVLVTLTLVGVTAAHLVTPSMLLVLACAMGLATSLNSPAWYSVPSDMLSRDDLPAGVALNSVGFNIARVIGPALGGLLVQSAGPAAVFALDALSTLGVIVVLVRWRRQAAVTVLPSERIVGAVKAGLRYARHTPALQRVLLRAFAFMSCGSVVLALMPVLASETKGGPAGYGLLLGSLGLGAVAGAALLPALRRRGSTDAIIGAGSLLFGATCVGMALVRELHLLSPIFFCAGIAWMSVLSTLNVAAQTVSPPWVRARALAVYLVVFQAAIAGGSALWGAVAEAHGTVAAYGSAGLAVALGALALVRVRIAGSDKLDLTPTRHWPVPTVVGTPHPDAGPVVVQMQYRIDPARREEFLQAARALERIRRRDGAVEWWLLRDTEDAAVYVEVFATETWSEHLRQHERVSAADREVEERVLAFHLGAQRPLARHLIAAEPGFRPAVSDPSTGTP